MSARPVDVVDRLERLASHAPEGGVDPDQLWSRGRRRQGRRWAVCAAGCVALLACLAATVAAPVLRLVDPPTAVAPDGARRVLPDVLRSPGRWDPSFGPAPGPLSAVGRAPRGTWGLDISSLWGVSALTGESRFLDLPDDARLLGGAALSADGTRLAYWTSVGAAGQSTAHEDGRVPTGVAIRDLVTGEERRWDARTTHGLQADGLVWAGDDVLWFGGGAFRDTDQNSYTPMVWTWRSGSEPEVATNFPLRSLSLTVPAADGFLSAGGSASRRVRVVDTVGGVAAIRLVRDGSTTSSPALSPDGRRIAGLQQSPPVTMFGSSLPLVVGDIEAGRAEMTPVGDIRAGSVLGWRSSSVLVVGSTGLEGAPDRVELSVVDLADGSVTHLLDMTDGWLPTTFAADAWSGDVVDAPDAPFVPSPLWLGTGAAVLSLLVLAGWRGTRGRRGHP